MKINDLIILKRVLANTKVGPMPSASLRKYLKLLSVLNSYNTEFLDKKRDYAEQAAVTLGYDLNSINETQDKEIVGLIAPMLDEFIMTEVNVDTKILSWEDLETSILNFEGNSGLSMDEKSYIASMICTEEL